MAMRHVHEQPLDLGLSDSESNASFGDLDSNAILDDRPHPPPPQNTATAPKPAVAAPAAAVAAKPAPPSKPAPPAAEPAAKKPAADSDDDSDGGSVDLDFSSDSSLGLSEEEKSPAAKKKGKAAAPSKPAAAAVPTSTKPAATHAAKAESASHRSPSSSKRSHTGAAAHPAAPASAAKSDSLGFDDLSEDLDLGHDDMDFDLASQHNLGHAPQQARTHGAAGGSRKSSRASSRRTSIESAYSKPRPPPPQEPASSASTAGRRSNTSSPSLAPAQALGRALSPILKQQSPQRSRAQTPSQAPAGHSEQQQQSSLASTMAFEPSFANSTGRVSTADTIAAARARQAQKDEHAHNVLSGRGGSDSEAQLYEPPAAAGHRNAAGPASGNASANHISASAYLSGGSNVSGDAGGDSQSRRSGGRSRTPKPSRPDFFVTTREPISRKLQQIQKEAQIYNALPKVDPLIKRKKKKKVEAEAKAAAAADASGKDGGLSDEDAALNKLEQKKPSNKSHLSARRQAQQALDQSSASEEEEHQQGQHSDEEVAPIEHPSDSPWLDAVSANMGTVGGAGGVGGQAGGRSLGRARGHRASIVYKEHEPLVGLATAPPTVEDLAQRMQELFEMQRTPAAQAARRLKAQQLQGAGASMYPTAESTAGKFTYVFGQRVPVDAFPRSFSTARRCAAAQAQQHQRSLSTGASARSAAERAQVALAAALASIRPQIAAAVSSSAAGGQGAGAQAPLVALAKEGAEEAGMLSRDDSVVGTASEVAAAEAFEQSFASLSPDAYYQKLHSLSADAAQLGLTLDPTQTAFDFDKQLRAAEDADNETRSDVGSDVYSSASRSRIPVPKSKGAAPNRVRDPFGVYRNTPAGVGNMYLSELAARSSAQSGAWGPVDPASPQFGQAFAGGAGSHQAKPKKRFLAQGRVQQQQQGRVQPGKFSVERKRARQHAAYVAQLQAAQALELDQSGLTGTMQHPAMLQHLSLLDSHPEAAQFLGGGAASTNEALYDQGDEEQYDEQQQQQSHYYEDEVGNVQVQLSPFQQDPEAQDPDSDPRYPLGHHSHQERMARSRALAAQQQQSFLASEYGGGYNSKKSARSQLKAELMGTLHAGLFGAEDAQGPQPLPDFIPALPAENPLSGRGDFSSASPPANTQASSEQPGTARLHSSLLPSEATGASAFHFKNSRGERGFAASGGDNRGNKNNNDPAAALAAAFAGELGEDDEDEADELGSQTTASSHLQSLQQQQQHRRGSNQSMSSQQLDFDPAQTAFYVPLQGPPHSSVASTSGGDPDASFFVVPPGLLSSVSSAHFLGRDLHAVLSSRPLRKPAVQSSTSKSATKRRSDAQMERLFNPEKAREYEAERNKAIEQAEQARKQARREAKRREAQQQQQGSQSSRGRSISATRPVDPASDAAAVQRMRDAIAGHGTAAGDVVYEVSESQEQTPRTESDGAQTAHSQQQHVGDSSLAALADADEYGVQGSGDDAEEKQQQQSQAKARKEELFNRQRNEEKVRAGIAKFAALGAKRRDAAPDPVFLAKARPPAPLPKRESIATAGVVTEQPDVSRLDMLYFKARMSAQRLVAQRALQAEAEMAECSFQPNLDVVVLKGKLLSKQAMAKERERAARSKKKKKEKENGEEESEEEDDFSSIHSSTASTHLSSSQASGSAANQQQSAKDAAAATKARLDALYQAHHATQARLREQREAAAKAAAAAEAALPFAPNVHPHRPVAATVAMASTQFIKGFDEKVERMRRGAAQAAAASFAASLRSSAPASGTSSLGSMHFGGEKPPVAAAHQSYIAANKHVVLAAQVPASAPPPGTALSSLPFPAVQPRDNPAHTAAPGAGSFRPDSHTPVPQIIMPSAAGDAPFQMLSGANPGSPRSLNFAPSANKASFLQDGQALDKGLPSPDASHMIGFGSMSGTDKLASPTVASQSSGFDASSLGVNPSDLGLGIVLPNNSPGSMLPRALAIHEHVSSYSYQFAKAKVLEQQGAAQKVTTKMPTTGGATPPVREEWLSPKSRSGAATPNRIKASAAAATAITSPSSSTRARAASPAHVSTRASPTSPLAVATGVNTPPQQQQSQQRSAAASPAPVIAAATKPASPARKRSPSPSAHTQRGASPAHSSSTGDVSAAVASPSSSDSGISSNVAPVLLFVDIALPSGTERIVVHVGDRTEDLAAAFTREHALDPAYTPVIQQMLDQQVQALPPTA